MKEEAQNSPFYPPKIWLLPPPSSSPFSSSHTYTHLTLASYFFSTFSLDHPQEALRQAKNLLPLIIQPQPSKE